MNRINDTLTLGKIKREAAAIDRDRKAEALKKMMDAEREKRGLPEPEPIKRKVPFKVQCNQRAFFGESTNLFGAAKLLALQALQAPAEPVKPRNATPLPPPQEGLSVDELRDLVKVRSKTTLGRNDPCPCGSKKKYKKCHGRKNKS